MKKLVFIIAVVAWCVASHFAWADTPRQSDDAAVVRNLDIFNSLYKELNTYYVDTLDARKSIETAITAMLEDIDPYTEYISAQDQEDFQVIASGEYGGIGSYIMQRKDGGVFISGPYEGSPAARAGLRSGDKIIKIDGEDVSKLGSDEVSKRLKGQASTQIEVTVIRPYDVDSVKTFVFNREKIKVSPVPYYGVTHGNIGYINLTTFNEHSAELVKAALLELKANPAVKYIVLDLQGNGGGLLESAVQIVGMFVPKGTQVLQTRGRLKQQERTYKTTSEPIDTEIPLAVLIDGGSASAAEITAGALQDLDRAVIVGARSFGKGLVQTTRQLPFDAMLKVTIAKYYIPSGRLIQEVDYSNRDANGKAKVVADSLTNVFKTAHGREVRDGGGITPDIKVEYPETSRLIYNIVRDQWAFDYATWYASRHDEVPSPSEFKVTDEMFEEFKDFVDPDKFAYDKVCETGLEQLRKVAKVEGYINEETEAAFNRLDELLKHDLKHDLDIHRAEIEEYLSQEIMQRYYYERGSVEQSLLTDKALGAAAEMFNTAGKYREILKLK